MPTLIYLCESASSNVNTVEMTSTQIDTHSRDSINALKTVYRGLSNEKYVNVRFNQTEGIGSERNFYLALFHTFLYAKPFDVVLINSSFDFKFPDILPPNILTVELPLAFDRLLNDMFSNLTSRNISVILSSGNGRNDLNSLVTINTTDFNFMKVGRNCKTAQQNNSAIIVGGISGSNHGSIVDCYFSAFESFGASSAGSAKAAGMVLKMQDYAKNLFGLKRYLHSNEIKSIISYNGLIEPEYPVIQRKIQDLIP
jgi:hypothetical protein